MDAAGEQLAAGPRADRRAGRRALRGARGGRAPRAGGGRRAGRPAPVRRPDVRGGRGTRPARRDGQVRRAPRPTGWSASAPRPRPPGRTTARALDDLEARLHAVESEEMPVAVDAGRRDALAERTAASRQREVEARLTLRSAEERVALGGRVGRGAAARRPAGAAPPGPAGRRHPAPGGRRGDRRQGGRGRPAGWPSRLETSLAHAAARRERAIARRTEADAVLAAAHARAVELQARMGRADRRRARRRGRPRPADPARRTAGRAGARRVRGVRRRPDRRVRPGRPGAADPGGDGRVHGRQGAGGVGHRTAADAVRPGDPAAQGASAPSAT